MAPARIADHDIDSQFLERSSPRSFTAEEIPDAVLMSMFEAARWAPSSSNVQPWRCVYAKRGTPPFAPILEGLMPGNQRWAGAAAALVVFLSQIHAPRGDQQVVSATHGFDTGAAWMSFALQGHRLGWATHGMAGFFSDRLRAALTVPDGFDIIMVAAVGRRGPAEALPKDLQEREAPSTRRPLDGSVFAGVFTQT